MQRYRREWIPGATYFFTVNTYRRQALLTNPLFYRALKFALKDVKTTHPFDIEAFVLLPDHLHCIWKMPEDNADYSIRYSSFHIYVKKGILPHNWCSFVEPDNSAFGEL